jgi:glutaminase
LYYFMREHNPLFNDVSAETALRLYFSACSLSVNIQGLAAIGATLANNGICPLTGKHVVKADHAQKVLQLMYSCGMYDYSGRFAFEVGIPAKSGVSGAVVLSVPGQYGIAIWSPPLDSHGNSVRGVWVASELVKRYPTLNLFNSVMAFGQKSTASHTHNNTYRLISACSEGSAEDVKLLLEQHKIDVNVSDYDGRSALHLACAEGHIEVVKLLLQRGANIVAKDRFGSTPLSDAASFPKIRELLQDKLKETARKPTINTSLPVVSQKSSHEKVGLAKREAKAKPLLQKGPESSVEE